MFRLQHLTENLSDVGYYKDIHDIDELAKYHECPTCNLVYTDKNMCDLCYVRTTNPREIETRAPEVDVAHQKFLERQAFISSLLDSFILYLYEYATQTIFTRTITTKVYELRDGERVLISENETQEPVYFPGQDGINETVMGSTITEIITSYSGKQEFIVESAYSNLLGSQFTYITIHEERLSWLVLFMRLTQEYITRQPPANITLYFNNLQTQMFDYMTNFPNWKTEPNTFYDWVQIQLLRQ